MKVYNNTTMMDLLEYIKNYQAKNGKSPSYRMIMKAMNFSSLSMVFGYVGQLQSKGLIKKDNLGGIAISRKLNPDRTILAPLVGTVTCGNPILAVENIEGNYTLPADIFGTGETFLLHAKGESFALRETIGNMSVCRAGCVLFLVLNWKKRIKGRARRAG